MLHNFFLSLHNEENVLIRLGSEKPQESSGKMIQVRWCLEEKYYFLYDRTWEIYVRTLKWTKLIWSSLADGARLKSQKYFSLSHFLFPLLRSAHDLPPASEQSGKEKRESPNANICSPKRNMIRPANIVESEMLHPRSLILLIQLSEDFTAERVKRNLVGNCCFTDGAPHLAYASSLCFWRCCVRVISQVQLVLPSKCINFIAFTRAKSDFLSLDVLNNSQSAAA